MNATQQVKEKRGARAHAHEARAELREKIDVGSDFHAAHAPWIVKFTFWGTSARQPKSVRTAHLD